MKNSTILILIVIIIAIVGAFIGIHSSTTSSSNNSAQNLPTQTQNVVISMKDYNYFPREIHVKANQRVSVSLDSSVTGCLRSFTIPDMGVRKVLPTPKDTVEFTPTQKGTYKFACSMGMGYGTLYVE